VIALPLVLGLVACLADESAWMGPCRPPYHLPVAPWARPSESCYENGYYVGGGAPCRGEPRRLDEGTWGWDYMGWIFPRSVRLDWYHGRRCQGGTGSYRTDR
jgi:hypothetical protein